MKEPMEHILGSACYKTDLIRNAFIYFSLFPFSPWGKKGNFLVRYRVQTGLKTHDSSLASTTQVLAEITVMKYQLPFPTALFKRDWGVSGVSRGSGWP